MALPTQAQISQVAGTGCLGSIGKVVLGTPPSDHILISPLSLPSQTLVHSCSGSPGCSQL